MGDDEPTLLTGSGSPTRSYDSDGSASPELEEIPLVGKRRLPGLANGPGFNATKYWVRFWVQRHQELGMFLGSMPPSTGYVSGFNTTKYWVCFWVQHHQVLGTFLGSTPPSTGYVSGFNATKY